MTVHQVIASVPDYPVGNNVHLAKAFGYAVGTKVGLWIFGRQPLPCAVVGQGSSGLILCAYVAEALIKAGVDARIYHARKPGERTHDRLLVEDGYRPGCKLVVVDDRICSGATLRQIVQELRRRSGTRPDEILRIDVLAIGIVSEPMAFKESLPDLKVSIEHLVMPKNPQLAKTLTE